MKIQENKMKTPTFQLNRFRCVFLAIWLTGCGLNPQNVEVDLNETLPEAKVTVYQKAIDQLGLMGTVYGDAPLVVMPQEIMDDTGTSGATGAEIPRNITEMVKSTLNNIGGRVSYIPYEPIIESNLVAMGKSENGNKIRPHVMLSGGITEFDRGLVTTTDSSQIGINFDKGGYGVELSDSDKSSLASVTLDFNLINIETFAGIPRMQAINGIKLHKATKDDSIGFTIHSATFGASGNIKKIQGRHAAVRLLVQLSMIQIIGRYQNLPYWRLIPGAAPDEVVIDRVLGHYYALTKPEQITQVQKLLYIHGFNVTPNGELDNATQNALQEFAHKQHLSSSNLDQKLYLALYENIPISAATRQRRESLATIAVAQHTTTKTPTTSVEKSSSALSNTGQLTLKTSKPDYKVGDPLNVQFSVSEPMYVRIAVINSKGQVDTLFPNPYQSESYCKPGKTYTIPDGNADFAVTIGGPAGTDKIRAVASTKPIPANALAFTKDGQFDEQKMAQYPVRAATDYEIHP